jgi:hypothetical protein
LVTASGLHTSFFDACPSPGSNPEAVYWRKVEKMAAENAARAEKDAESKLKKLASKDEDKSGKK